jgi:CubicO group peptidase (beta-lactamase class C family)
VTKGAPGASVAVSVNGRTVLAEGYGFADVENGRYVNLLFNLS